MPPTVDQVWNDPDFQGLPIAEKRQVLSHIDPDFSGLPAQEQDKVLAVHTVQSAASQPDNAGLQDAASKISKVMSFLNNPGGKTMPANTNVLEAQGNDIFNKAGGAISDYLVAKMPNHPYLAALPGTAVSLLNPQNFMAPAEGSGVQLTKPAPALPANEAASGVPFTRAEISQNPTALGVQSMIQGSPTGGLALNPFKEAQAAKLQAFQDAVQGKLGTSDSPSVTGSTIRDSLLKEDAANKTIKDALYAKVPQDAPIPAPSATALYQKLADDIKLNAPSLAKIIEKRLKPENPVQPGDVGNFKGDTQYPDATAVGGGHYPETVLGKPRYKVGYEASPGTPSQIPNTPTLGDLKQLRTELGAVARGGGIEAHYAWELKKAVNEDFANLTNPKASPLDQLMGKDAQESLQKATTYYKDYAQLQDHPVTKALNNAKTEDLQDIMFKGGRAEDVQVGRAALGEVGFKAAQKQYFTDLLNKKNIGAEIDKLNTNNPEFLKQALTSDQLDALQTIDALKKRAASAGKVEPLAGSSKMNMWLALLHGMATSPVKTLVTGGILPYMGAQHLLNTAGSALNVSAPVVTGMMAATGNAPRAKTGLQIIRDHLNKR